MRISEEELKIEREKEFEEREKQLENAKPQELIKSFENKEKLHITYVMTWTGVCGGSKIILEHANKLTERGHKITIISHDEKPGWYRLNNNVEFIEVPWTQKLCEAIPNCDLIIATYWREIYECIQQKIAPVIYFEQGDFHLFDLDNLNERTYNYIRKQFKTVKFIYTVSSFAKEKIKEIYDSDSIVIPNAVDNTIFFKGENKQSNLVPKVAIIGSENAKFKRIQNIVQALQQLKKDGYNFEIKWITPDEPKKINIDAIVNPPQIVIGDTLRESDIFVCASMYESFCLPVLEAMTCGNAIVTTNNGGNMDFVVDGENALLMEKDNIEDIYNKVKRLLDNKELRDRLSKNAEEKSQQYSWDNTINMIENYYKSVALFRVAQTN